MKRQLEGRYKIKTQWLGPGEEHLQGVKILNRVVCWCNEKGITFEVDPRHTEITIDQLRLKDTKAVCTPGIKEEGTTTQDADEDVVLQLPAFTHQIIILVAAATKFTTSISRDHSGWYTSYDGSIGD